MKAEGETVEKRARLHTIARSSGGPGRCWITIGDRRDALHPRLDGACKLPTG
jgi:hypothetical protein